MKTVMTIFRAVVLATAFCAASLATSYAADRTISANYTLTADETVDGILTVESGVTVDLNGHSLSVKGLAGDGTITSPGGVDLTSPDPNEERVSYTTGSGSLYGETKAINLFNNNYRRSTSGTANRVILATDNLPLAVTYDFGADSPKVVDLYKVYSGPYGRTGQLFTRSPMSWTFEGSNDNDTWTPLDSRAAETDWSRGSETRTYTFANTTAYRYYRITFTAAGAGATYLELVQLEYSCVADLPATQSELHVNIPGGASVTNSTVTITGSIRLVKEGAGEFVSAKAEQIYSGGNRVVSGTLKAAPEVNHPFGFRESEMLVERGATFDFNGSIYCHVYSFTLNGGTVANTGANLGMSNSMLTGVTLTDDSVINLTAEGNFNNDNGDHTSLSINLDGHLLDVTNAVTFRLENADVSPGTIRITGNGGTIFNGVRAPSTSFDIGGVLGSFVDLGFDSAPVSNLTLRSDCTATTRTSGSTAPICVYGTFKTATTDFPFIQLEDGSTFDLTAQNGTFDTASTSANANNFRLTFATNATVTLDLSGRTLALGDCIVEWDETPQGITILFDAATASGGVAPVITDRGIFYGHVANAVEWAWWTGEANDGDLTNPRNWLCKDAIGDTVQNGLPSSTTRVYLEGNALNVQVPANSTLTCDVCVITNCTLAADCDLRGIGEKLQVADGATVNLNGHRLYLPSTALTGNCTVKGADIDHADDLTTTDSSRVWSPTTCYINGMTAANLFNNNYARATGNKAQTKRVIVESSNWPLIVRYDFGEATVVDAYRIWTGPISSYSHRLPMTWKFEGSNDIENDNWILLDARHAETEWTTANVHRTYTFDNTTAYRYYRMTVTSNFCADSTGNSYLELVQLEYFHLKPTRGELHIDAVADVGKLELPGLTLDGNMRLFIEGTGALRFTKTGQTYVGGTEICSGTVIPGSGTASILRSDLFGEAGGEVVVRGDGSGTASATCALFDFGTRFGYTGYKYVLAGGILQNSCGAVAELRLATNSYMKATTELGSGDSAWIGSTGTTSIGYADLGGHELSVTIASGRKFGLSNATLENGTLYIREGGWFITTNSVVATNDVTIQVKAAPDIGGTISVCNYTQLDTSLNYNMGECVIDVYGIFTPGAKGQFHGTMMHDGSVLDLRALTSLPLNAVAPFNTEKANAKGVRTLLFEPGATIGVKLGERHVSVNTPVITWTAAEKPDATVTFKSADTGAVKPGFIVQDDGLYLVNPGFLLMIR